jgi:lysyl oxidase
MRSFWLKLSPAVIAASVVALVSAQPALSTHTAGAAGADLLPDLQTLEPRDLRVETVRVGPRLERRLRFSNEVQNAHTGPLELVPRSEDCDGDGDVKNDRRAYQRVYRDKDGNGFFERGIDTGFSEVPIGCMIFHPQHQHWHFENFARYELTTLPSAGGAIVRSSTKVAFCIIDINRHPELGLPGSPAAKYYTTCGRNSTYGISVGWSDEYASTVAGQYVTITGVPDGQYCLASTANPPPPAGDLARQQMREISTANNRAAVPITLAGGTVSKLLNQSC